jgi:CheY-like chemotaxis protein
MPESTGFDLIRQLRSLPPDRGGRIPAVAVTSYADPNNGRRALEAGFHSHLPKPIDPIAIAVEVVRAARQADA